MPRRKLLFLSLSSRQFGGGEVYLLNLLRHFRERDDVFVACAAENELMIERVRALDLPHEAMPLGYRTLPAVVRRLQALHAQHGFDLVHANGRRSQLFGALLAQRTGLPVVGADLVATLDWTGSPAAVLQNLVAAVLNRLVAVPRLRRIVVLTDHMRQESLRWLRVPPERIVTVPNAVDPEWFQPREPDAALRAGLGVPPEAPVVLCSARLVEHKGHDLLLDALDRLPDVFPLLIGDGPLEARLRARLSGRPYALLDFPLDIRPYYALADVVALTSRQEGLPTALLQAMAMERPVVGTDVQGIPEVVRPGENGWLAPLGRPEVLADRLRSLVDDPALRLQMGRRGREIVLERFSLPRMLQRIEEVYASALR